MHGTIELSVLGVRTGPLVNPYAQTYHEARGRARMLVSLLCLSPAALVAPTKLVVLQHGLYGAAINMAVLQQELERLGGGEVLVH